MNLSNKEYSVADFTRAVLKERFPNTKAKQDVYDDNDDKLNFACPYCGDSNTNLTKKRGNIFFRSNTFKCFNDGCLKFTKLNKFIAEFAMKYSLPMPSNIKEDEKSTVNPVTKRGFLIEFLMNPKVKDCLLDFKELASRFFLTPCKDAPSDSPIGEYVLRRHITKLPAFEQSCYYDNREDKIYIFNLDLRSGRVLGLSIRMIDSNYAGPKYNIKNYSEFKKNGLVGDVDDDIISKIDTINNFFNILNVKFNEPVFVLEGQIDAMFLKNSIATTGVTKSKTALSTILSKKNAHILFDNDRAGKEESIKLIKEGYKVFLWSKLISEIRKKYPSNRKEVNEIKDINDLYDFYIDMGRSYDYDQFSDHIIGYFSESVFDLISV